MNRLSPWKSRRVVILLAAFVSNSGPLKADDASDVAFFETSIRPLIVEKCQTCHGNDKAKGGLRLTDREALLKGGESGPAVVPKAPAESRLVHAVRYLDELKMPPKQRLSDGEIAAIEKWIASGAPWPASSTSKTTALASFEPSPAHKAWWAFQPLRSEPPPSADPSVNPIDAFLFETLKAKGITPAKPADRRTLIRRATFDITGLPPTPEDVSNFLADESANAFEKVVDRLLASPSYGQRWARHWLDVARYADYYDADPKARTPSCELTEAWRYRDWVVDSLNRDLPYDQFIVHQIAGDLLPAPDGKEIYPAGLIATTFLSNGVWDRGDADKEKIVSDMVDDQIDTVGKAFLGLTLGCARCHDHKFDPVSQNDYYALAGIFYSTHILKDLGAKGAEYVMNRVPLVSKAEREAWDKQNRLIDEAQAKIAAIDKMTPKTPEKDKERTELIAERDRLKKSLPPEPPLAMAVQDEGTPGGLFPKIQDVPLHIRGTYTRLGPVIPRGLPRFLAGEKQEPIREGSGRKELARWVASKSNPLTARVIVNRVWAWHFGDGLVRTPSNFGMRSEPPSHPKLLDWLATRFVEEGWSLKTLHRRIMLTEAYRRSSVVDRDQIARDPENRELGRFSPRRLDAEEMRDALLFVGGGLDPTAGGPAADGIDTPKRSLYVQTARWDRSSLAMLFDAANPDSSTEKRNVSTVAPQALLFLNHPFVFNQAKRFAERLASEVPNDDNARIERAYQLLFSRSARPDEIEICRAFLFRGDKPDWPGLAHLLLCGNEFMYVD